MAVFHEDPAPTPKTNNLSFDWHKECDLEYRHTVRDGVRTARAYWCQRHNQWVYEKPSFICATFADGVEVDL
jgi:hypothetical protein